MTAQDPEELAKEAQLKYIQDDIPGFSRKKSGKGFTYFGNGVKITDKKVTERINKLVIPPAWTDVWISPFKNSHLQATGRDERGRKQYIYHSGWNSVCQQNKFNRVIFFGKILPLIRAHIKKDLYLQNLERERILATVVWLLENTFVRVGNREYAQDNNSYGLTTLRNKHVNLKNDSVEFVFKGKSGVPHKVSIKNPRVVKTIRSCVELPGYTLFKYFEDGEKRVVDSADVNQYLKIITGEDITAKDFRTWGGTVVSATALNDIGPFSNKKECDQNIVTAVKIVSSHLRNTPSVCRNYYIHPKIIEAYQTERLIPHFRTITSRLNRKPELLSAEEFAVISLLES